MGDSPHPVADEGQGSDGFPIYIGIEKGRPMAVSPSASHFLPSMSRNSKYTLYLRCRKTHFSHI